MTEKIKAKIKLFKILLDLSVVEITDNEIDIMYQLSNDEEIQPFLKSKK